MNSHILGKALTLVPAIAFLATTAHAKLAAWYPLDASPSSAAVVTENVSANNATMIGYNVDPALNFIDRGHPAASKRLGTSYLLRKGGALNLGASPAVQPTDKFTISFFFQPGTFAPYNRFLESQVGNANTQYGLRIDTAAQGNRVRVLLRDNSAANAQLTHPTILKNDGTWYFCAFRYDSANTDFRMTLLPIGSNPIDEAAITAATANLAAFTTGPMTSPHALPTHIGTENVTATGAYTLHAALDELAFYDNSDGMGVLNNAQLAAAATFGPSGVELVTAFNTDKQSAGAGNPATLSWTVNEPFDTLTLSDGFGTITDLSPLTAAGSGSTTVTPTATTTYYLKGVRGAVANVHTLKILFGAAPEINSLTSSNGIVTTNGTATLSWNVLGATSIVLDPGAIDVTALTTTDVTVAATTTYTLSATNGSGTTTKNITITATDGPVPTNLYAAATGANTPTAWTDQIGGKNLALTGLIRNVPLITPSLNTNITASYQSEGGVVGGVAAAYQYANSTFEIWFRPAALTADHGVIFETGGGQNGLSILINENGLRFLGSALNVRTLDLVVPLTGVNLDDFIQVLFSTSATTDAFEVAVRDTYGNVITQSAIADIALGGNAATLFNWGGGAVGGDAINLGGRTEIADTSPAGLSSFVGEIGIVNIYNRLLTPAEIQSSFDIVATTTSGPAGLLITSVSPNTQNNTLTLSWNSRNGVNYRAQFSTSLNPEEWFDLAGPFTATDVTTTETLALPPNQPKFFVRIVENSP